MLHGSLFFLFSILRYKRMISLKEGSFILYSRGVGCVRLTTALSSLLSPRKIINFYLWKKKDRKDRRFKWWMNEWIFKLVGAIFHIVLVVGWSSWYSYFILFYFIQDLVCNRILTISMPSVWLVDLLHRLKRSQLNGRPYINPRPVALRVIIGMSNGTTVAVLKWSLCCEAVVCWRGGGSPFIEETRRAAWRFKS